ncbi:acetolactate synthase large subunit [Jatrophihabitans sp.]|uniref:acetolactate synthase large subunit n=1 Tax=Jatrophihabitans sp. TaxID=1932789 RepID=UPI0032C21043
MIGAEALIGSLVGAGVDVCFMNPGTSEMHFVASLDAVPEMRGVLTLFEGVATGAADGWARMTGRPAAVLLHLGPGLGNGLANLHNARRAHTPMVVVVGAHATHHERYDAPLQSDIESLAGTVSGWVHTSGHPRDVAHDAMGAVRSARRDRHIATLVLPADVSWSDGGVPAPPPTITSPTEMSPERLQALVPLLDGDATTLFLGGGALTERGLRAASRIVAATGVRLLAETFPARLERGAGRPAVDRLAYLAEAAEAQLAGTTTLLLAGAAAPVSFFAYPGRASDLVPDGCTVERLTGPGDDVEAALVLLADRLAAGVEPVLAPAAVPAAPEGAITARTLAAAVALTLPADAVLVDEAITAGGGLPAATAGAAPHTLLTLTGGAIGQGLPVATGAAVAAPGRRVVAIVGDGSAMYTIQSLWTQARENLDVTTVIVNNASYAILRAELHRVGGEGTGPRAEQMLDIGGPRLDFTELAAGLGVDGVRVHDAAELTAELRRANAAPGPHLIEAMFGP